MADLINEKDTLNQGRVKLNDSIEASDRAEEKSDQAVEDASRALSKSESTQTQLDTIVVEGDSSVEAAQARVDEDGKTHGTLKERIDSGFEDTSSKIEDNYDDVTSQLAKTDDQSFLNRPISRFAERRPMITIHDDDGNRGFYTKMFEVAKEYNIPIVSAMITNSGMGFPGGPPTNNRQYTFEEVMEMKESGLVEFVSHTYSHPLNMNDMPREELKEEFIKSRDFMKKWGFNHRVVVIPGGHINEKVVEEARQVYEYMTTFGGANIVATPPFSNYKIPRVNFDRDIEQIKGFIDEAHENNSWIILRTHVDQSQDIETPSHRYSNEKFREIIDYAQSLNFDFVTTEEGIRNHANILEFNEDNTVNANGEIYSDQLGRVILNDFDLEGSLITSETTIDKFSDKTVTNSIIRTDNAEGFPVGTGMLETYKMSATSNLWNYQTYKPTRTNELFIRHYDINDEQWSQWVSVNSITLLDVNSVPIDRRVSHAQLRGRITVCKIDSNNEEISSFPEKKTGILTTYAFHADSFAYQEYQIRKEGTLYKRDWDSNEASWGSWYLKNTKVVERTDTISSDKKPLEFPQGITVSRNTANNPFIEGVGGGVVRTTMFRSDESSYWAKQEYLVNDVRGDEPKMYIRAGNVDNKWSEWRKIVTEEL